MFNTQVAFPENYDLVNYKDKLQTNLSNQNAYRNTSMSLLSKHFCWLGYRLGWTGLGWAGLGWAGLCGDSGQCPHSPPRRHWAGGRREEETNLAWQTGRHHHHHTAHEGTLNAEHEIRCFYTFYSAAVFCGVRVTIPAAVLTYQVPVIAHTWPTDCSLIFTVCV